MKNDKSIQRLVVPEGVDYWKLNKSIQKRDKTIGNGKIIVGAHEQGFKG